MTDLQKIWHNDAEWVSKVHWKITKLYFRNPTWQTADALEKCILRHHEISQFFDFQDGGRILDL